MLNMCVQFLVENHTLVMDEHLEMLDRLWHHKYEAAATTPQLEAAITPQLAAERPLPLSPPPEPEPEPELQHIPQIFPVQEAVASEPKKPRKPIYTNRLWPSPVAKVFVQHIRGRNAWNSYRHWRGYGGVWTDSDFNSFWLSAGNTEHKLTHDNCMRYLASRMGGLTPEQLMEKTPQEVHSKLIGDYFGVPGYYTKRYWY